MSALNRLKDDETDSRTPRCLRCDYDLRGAVATWTDSCPLEGTCTECGLEYEWRHVVGRHGPHPVWCVERRGVLRFPWRVIATLAITFLPWKFWRALNMWHPFRPLRIAAYLLSLVMVIATTAYLIGGGSAAVKSYNQYAGGALMSDVRPGPYVLKVLLTPASTEWTGRIITRSGQPTALPAPATVWRSMSIFGGDRAWQIFLRLAPDVGRTALLMHLLFALVLLLIPESLARVNVAPRHLVRSALYGMGLLIPVVLSGAVAVAMRPWDNGWTYGAGWFGGIFLMTAEPVLLALWWWMALKVHLRLPQAGAVAMTQLMITMGVLLAFFLYTERPLDWLFFFDPIHGWKL